MRRTLPAAGLGAALRPHLLDATMFWSSAGVGGVRRVIETKRSALRQRGWRHTLMAPGVRGPGRVDCGGWPVPASGGYRFVVQRQRAAALIERCQPDLIEAADPFVLASAVADAANALQVPAIAFCHSDLTHWARGLLGGQGRVADWGERQARRHLARLYADFDLVLAPSRAMTARLADLGVRHAMHQPLGVDCRIFRPEAREPAWRRALLARLGLAPHTRLVAYAGRFSAEKHLDLLAAAVDRLGPGHVLVAMGAGPRPPRPGRAVRLLPPGPAAEVARLLASADVFAHAGDQETFGLAALEAMACGRPLVVRHREGLAELADGVGTRVDSDRAEDWAEALRAALAAADDRPCEAALARARAHDWPHVIDHLAGHYLRLLGAGHAPDGGGPAAWAPGALGHA
ncbi:glycosyltransferase [Ideonella sp.]|uniref:glycosyltransferase n=1 Tax=Ideonella sp. TaxID=1929293 RepID=UPI0035B155D1